MIIFRYDTLGIGGYRTIHKLIVIFISLYQSKTVMRILTDNIWPGQYCIYYRLRYSWRNISSQDLCIFFHNFIGNAQVIFTSKECLPNTAVRTLRCDRHN